MGTTPPARDSAHARAAGPAVHHGMRARLALAADPLIVLALTVLAVVSLPYIDSSAAAFRAVGPVAYALVMLAAAVTLVRARWPVAAVLVAGAAVGTYLVLSYPYGPVFGFVVLTVYTVARHRPLRIAGAAAAATVAMLLAHVPVNEAALAGTVAVLPALAWVAVPFTIGAARRMVVAAGQRERLAADQRLVDAERLRLSQDVHDVVGHGLAAIQMQADVTLHVHAREPDRMRATLETISRASRDALAELRATLEAVRADGERGLVSPAPTPGLARVSELCERVDEAGVTVDLSIQGQAQPLPPAADVAAYRVLQEALTNVVKHSAHQHARVLIRHDPRVVTLEVTNQDLGPVPAEGIGISGMRRRVSQVGGTFHAGPGRRHGTFQVRAVIARTREELAR